MFFTFKCEIDFKLKALYLNKFDSETNFFLCFLLIILQSESRKCIYEIPREQTSIVSKSVLLKYPLDQNSWSRGKIFHMLKWIVKLNIYLYQTSKICLNIILIGNYENLQFDETNFIWQLLLNINLLEILKKA